MIDLELIADSELNLPAAVNRLPLHSKFTLRLKSISGGREVWAIGDQALVSGTNFLTSVIVARSLGMSEFGVFALAWMAVLFFASMQMAGIIAPMMSLAPKTASPDRPCYFGGVFVQEALFVSASALLLWRGLKVVAILSHQPSLERLAGPLCVSLIAYLLQDFFRRYLFTTRQSCRAFINDAVSCVPQLPLVFYFTRLHVIGSAGVLWFVGLTSLIGVALGAYWFEPVVFRRAAILSTAIRHWRISRWLALSTLLWWTSTNLFVLVAPAYYGALAGGVLRASQNMVALANVWFLGLDNVIPAETARLLHEGGVTAASRYFQRMFLRWGLVTAVFVGVLSISPGFWLHIAYGSKYAAYGYLLRLYGVAYVLNFTGRMLGGAMQALEYTAPLFWSYLLMTAFSLATAGPLVKHLGLRGVLIGAIATHILFIGILLVSLSRRVRKVSHSSILGTAEPSTGHEEAGRV